jgi:spore coat polysaccharide biosynthesis predicted glycosyltransferase SpsG
MEFKHLAIFTEAGDGIGLGHLMRCRAIADAFREVNWEVTIHLYWKGVHCPTDDDLRVYNWHAQTLSEDGTNAQIALVDSYLADVSVYRSIAKKYPFTCAIDDYNRLVYPVSLVLNPGITAGRIDYSNQVAEVLEGKSFILLRAEVRHANKVLQAIREDLKVITITVGGSDVHELLPRLGSWVREILPDAQIRIILPDVQQAEALRNALATVDVFGRQTASEMVMLFQSSDLVISACGQTLHELACLGTPFIGILTGDDQRYNQAYYIENGILGAELRYDDESLEDKIRIQLEGLRLPERRKHLAGRLPELVSQNGAANSRNAMIDRLGT